ncbi:putative anthocyanidin reductase [Zingiber officinale]|uniref:putative anthocyanidin reductase n=1 Tax=Zingiber officinale TaxID=94328 RepID=UPI001C4C6A10|nr:putative anthocyanidin reductase [Zingiber officinale]
MEEGRRSCRVCVTGATGFMGSLLVKKLLEKGHVVHATVRNPGDEFKVGFLRNLAGAGAGTRLSLFSADLYDAHTFAPAIHGCEFVFLVAIPFQHIPSSQFKDIAEATVSSVRTILQLCERSRTVRRVIFTGSVTASSAMKEDGSGFKEAMDESCWTPLHLPFRYCEDFEKDYTRSKTLSEKEILSYNDERRETSMEAVTLTSGLFGGDTILSHLPLSSQIVVSPMTGNPVHRRQLKFLHALLGSVPVVHIDDVCEAHAFCMEPPSMAGRFLCAAGYPALQQIADYYAKKFPDQLPVITKEEDEEAAKVYVPGKSTKLTDLGFRYKHTVEQILDDSFESATRFGVLLDKTTSEQY